MSGLIVAAASVEAGLIARGGARREVEFDAAQGLEPGANGGCQILRGRRLAVELRLQDVAGFGLQGPPVLSRPLSQTALQSSVEVANDDAGDDRASVSNVMSL